MNPSSVSLAGASHAVAALAYGAYALFGIYLLIWGTPLQRAARSVRWSTAAVLASSAWAAVSWLALNWSADWLPVAASVLDLLRYGLWFGFLLALFGTDPLSSSAGSDADAAGSNRRPPAFTRLRLAAGVALAAAAAMVLLRPMGAAAVVDGDAVARLWVVSALALPVLGLLTIEQLFRNLREDVRWPLKPVFLGLACVFVFDVYLYAEGLLFAHLDPDALAVRGIAHALAVPFLFIAARRGSGWLARLQVSRAAAFHSATLVLAGGYLLFMSAIGYYVRYFGGEWGRGLQIGLLIAAVALLGTLAFSSALRSWLRVFVGKHFFRLRYDYRQEWLRFTAMLSSQGSPQVMGEGIVRGLAGMVESPAGALWTRSEDGYVQTGNWLLPEVMPTEPADSSLCRFLLGDGWVIDLDEFRDSPRRYEGLALPTWLLGLRNGWLVVPLLAGDELAGFVVLARPLTRIQINWEVLDLLKTAGRQAGGYLAQMQATEALLDARKFEAFNRMSAFVVHDLKNIVAQLSLMLKNAERLHANREFQQDMLLTVESSLEKMKRLMLQLREGATPPGGSRGVELTPIVRRLQSLVQAQGRELQVRQLQELSTRGHVDRLERVLGHLVQNALEATAAVADAAHGRSDGESDGNGDGNADRDRERVWIGVERVSGQVRVEVGDSGCGMSESFVRDRLFRPFHTTKQTGMGIGTYESFQYIRELGGSIAVDSEPGRGSVIHVLLPLFETQRGSDLLRSDAAR